MLIGICILFQVESVSSKSMVSPLDDIHTVVKAVDSIPDYELDNLLGPYEVNELNFMQEINNDSTDTMKCDHDQIFSFDWDLLHTQTSTNKRRKIEVNFIAHYNCKFSYVLI